MPFLPAHGEAIRISSGTLPIVLVVGIIFSAMYAGWATSTEAGALGAFVVLVIALFRGMKWGRCKTR